MAPRPQSSKAVLTSPLSVSLTVEEREQVREAAFLTGQSVSAFMRGAAVRSAERVLKSKRAPVLAATG